MIEDIAPTEFEFSTVVVTGDGQVNERKTLCARQFIEKLSNAMTIDLVLIPGGTFQMGLSTRSKYEDETPQHRVTVSPFLMSKYPITQEQWQLFMGKNPSRFKGDQYPVENISWKDANQFCERLSAKTKRRYQLPSEAQWEYACRALTTSPFYFGATLTTDLANYNGEFIYHSEPKGVYRHTTTDVGSFPPNAFGLYDMHGNVWEWCADSWHDTYIGAPSDERAWDNGDKMFRVARGGCWHDTPHVCRSTTRLKLRADEGDEIVGFRIVIR